jgi:hypothetical protein
VFAIVLGYETALKGTTLSAHPPALNKMQAGGKINHILRNDITVAITVSA